MASWWDKAVTGFQSKQGANALIGLGAGLLGGRTFAEGLASGAQQSMHGNQLDQQYAAEAERKAKEEQGLNSTIEFMRGKGYDDLIAGVESGGMDMGAAWTEALRRGEPGYGQIGGANAPSNVQEWEYYSQLPPDQQSQYLTMKRSNSPLNIGTGFVTQDMANPGNIIGAPIAIENRQEAYDTGYGAVEGKADAESAALAESIQSKMPGLRTVIDDLTALADTATYTQSGQAMDAVKRELGLPVGQGAIDRSSYIAIVDNQVLPLLRDTFGAAFTQKEGESLRATLGDPNKSPAEKKAILNAFIAQKERDVAGMQSRAAGQGGGQNFVYNPATGKLEPQ